MKKTVIYMTKEPLGAAAKPAGPDCPVSAPHSPGASPVPTPRLGFMYPLSPESTD